MKNRFILRFAKERDLPWETHPNCALFLAQAHVRSTSDVLYRVDCVPYRGRKTTVIVFCEDDHRQRLHDLSFSNEEIDRVRRALELPEGTQPRWYELNGQYPEGTTFDSDDDVDWEDHRTRRSESEVENLGRMLGAFGLDESNAREGVRKPEKLE